VIFNPDGHIEYAQAKVNEEKDLGGVSGFVCRDCGYELYFCGCRIETEKGLIDYLSIDPAKREEDEEKYQECLDNQAEEEEKRQDEVVESYSAAAGE
jgi:hypothetical protein